MKTILFALALAFGVAAVAQVPNSITVQKTAGAWVVYQPDGTILPTSGSVTFGLQEALNFWGANQYPLRILCGGAADPFIFPVGTSIVVPPSIALLEARGCRFVFRNYTTGGNGFTVDTQQNNKIDFGGAQTYCDGCGYIWLLQPKSIVQGVYWSNASEYDLGYIAATGGAPVVLGVDVTRVAGANQPASSQFVNNRVRAMLAGRGYAIFNFRYLSPVSDHQVGGENTFDFLTNEGSLYAEIYIGSMYGNVLDRNLGTNKYQGNLGHTSTNPGGWNIITDAPWDYYDLRSMNIYGIADYNVYWGPFACKNVIRTTQIIPGSVGVAVNTCPANDNVIGPP